MKLEQRQQAMLQLHLHDHQLYCRPRYGLYWKSDGIHNHIFWVDVQMTTTTDGDSILLWEHSNNNNDNNNNDNK